jgi:hypothetical protein
LAARLAVSPWLALTAAAILDRFWLGIGVWLKAWLNMLRQRLINQALNVFE